VTEPLRIGFDVTSCAKPEPGGIGNYGRGLVAACARVAPEHAYTLAVRPNRWSKRRLLADLACGQPVRLLVDPLVRFTLGQIDVLHAIGVRLPPRGSFARIVTVHDLNVFEFPELSTPSWRRKRSARIRETVARADLVIAYSEQGASSLMDHLGISRARIRVVPAGVDLDRFRPLEAAERDPVLATYELRGRPYLFNLGPFGSRKNQMGLLEAFAHAGLDEAWCLVLAGPEGDGARALCDRAESLGLKRERIRLPGRVPAADLPALLGGSRGYVCASLHEGFAIPVAEAQASGVPVASSNRGALPETVGDCGLLFDPCDLDAFAGALRRLAEDASFSADLARRGRERAQRVFSWDAIARRMLALYAEVATARAA
jgi:glycosyltransferase involved in cell wall biosynthesis